MFYRKIHLDKVFKMASKNDTREVRISKTMSYILRHGAEKEKIPINKGWSYYRIRLIKKH